MFIAEGLAQNAETGKNVASLLNPDLVMEAKFDGFRLLIHVGANGVEAFTRTGKSQKGKLPHIEAALSHLPADTWLDGEIVAFDAKGIPEWGKVQSKMGSTAGDPNGTLTYVAFDILSYGGLDIRPLPLSERRAALEQVITNIDRCSVAPQVPADDEFHDNLVALGYEGSIVKDPTAPYASGCRGHGWWKLKPSDEMDVVIMGFKPGENSFTGYIGAIEFGQYQECGCVSNLGRVKLGVCANCNNNRRKLISRGRCSGMDMATRADLTNNQSSYIGTVISMAYMGMLNGNARHPQFKRFRPDKLALDCDWTTK